MADDHNIQQSNGRQTLSAETWEVGWGDGLTGPNMSTLAVHEFGRSLVPIRCGKRLVAAVPVLENNHTHLIAAAPELLEALKAAEPLLMTLCSVALKAEISGHLPFGLKEQVEEWLRGNIGGKAISKAERGQ